MIKIAFLTVLIILLLSGYSNAETNETVNVDELAIPDYGPHIFEELKNEPEVIDVRGTIPIIVNNREKLEWTDKLVEFSMNLEKEMNKYFHDGSLLSFGTSIDGYLEVGCNSATPEKINNTVIDEIYSVIDNQCKKEGINNVPVVFKWTEMGTEETPGFTSVMLTLCILILISIRR